MPAELKVKRILFATDFLGSSRVALDYAVAFAHHFAATIVMVHALELEFPANEVEMATSRPSVTQSVAQARLAAIARQVRLAGVEVEAFVEEGIPSDVILGAISAQSADLLVLGVHGVHRGLTHLLIGSNTEKILLAACCPTMTVGAHVLAGVDPKLHFNEVLYFSDLSPDAAAAAAYAAFLGKELNAPVDVCQLLPEAAANDPAIRQTLMEEYCGSIARVFPGAASLWTQPSFHLDRGMEVEEMIGRARQLNSGLIVLGVHAESHLRRHLHTSFAYRLLAQATCPVVTVRRPPCGDV